MSMYMFEHEEICSNLEVIEEFFMKEWKIQRFKE